MGRGQGRSSGTSHTSGMFCCGWTDPGPRLQVPPPGCVQTSPALSGGGWGARWRVLQASSLLSMLAFWRDLCVCSARVTLFPCVCPHAFTYTCAWLQLGVCVCTHVCLQVCMDVHVCIHVCNWVFTGDPETPRRGWEGSDRSQKNPQDTASATWGVEGGPPLGSAEPLTDRSGRGQEVVLAPAWPLRDGVVPEHADRLGAFLRLQEDVLHPHGPLQGAGQRRPLAVHHRTHDWRVDDRPVGQPAGRSTAQHTPACHPGERSGTHRACTLGAAAWPRRRCAGAGAR